MRLSDQFFRVTVFFLIVCLTSLFVPAQIVDGGQRTIIANSPISTGVLNISEETEIYVNGNRAQDGMTVLSGAEVETREKGAIVALSNLGIVRICRQTKMNLAFDSGRVEIKLMSGNARLELNPNGSGEILTPAGGNIAADANGIALTPNYDSATCDCRNEAIAAAAVPVGALSGILPFLGIGGGAVAAVLIGTNLDGDNLPASISAVIP